MASIRNNWQTMSGERKFFTVLPFAAAGVDATIPLQLHVLNSVANQMAADPYSAGGPEFFLALYGGAIFDFLDVFALGALVGYVGYGIYRGIKHFTAESAEDNPSPQMVPRRRRISSAPRKIA